MNVPAIRARVADTLRRDAAITAAKVTIDEGDRPKPDFGGSFPLMRVSTSRAPVTRRKLGTGSNPDRHPRQEASCAVEVIIVSDRHATALESQDSAWALAALAEGAIARNARLADADGGDRLCHTTALKTVRYLGPRPGGEREVLSVAVMVTAIEDVGGPLLNSEGATA